MSRSSKDKRFRVGLIGSGKISEQHLIALSRQADVHLAGVCDLSPALAKHTAEKYGAERAYTDYRQMLAESRLDVAHVLTPGHTHPAIVSDCLNAGAHVYAEKPIAPSREQFHEMWALAQAKGLRLMENHNYRYNAPIRQIESLLAEGVLGEVRDVDVQVALNLRAPGGRYADANLPSPSHALPCGAIHEFITHMSYLMLRFIPKIQSVSAAWSNHEGDDLFKWDDLDAILFSDACHGRMRFSCRTAPDTFTVTVRGTKGWAQTDLFQPNMRIVKPRGGPAALTPLVNHAANGFGLVGASIGGFFDKVLRNKTYEGLYHLTDLTYEALRADSPWPIAYEDIDGALQLIEALLNPENQMVRQRSERVKEEASA